ncbi:hypothetical protein AB0A63_31255 [Lentzea sp. NPDC042327]|uniref:hypothetical protein n=1 Tax=Lentzea sp. NPDC042327 TaxID=3154801 RepID=UPI0033F9ABDF
MSNSTVNMAGVVSFVLEEADADNLDNLVEAIRSRRQILADIASASLTEGATVTTHNLRPKYLDGLTGAVTTIVRGRGRGRAHATVRLDKASTAELRVRSSKFHHLAGRDSYDLQGIPLSCLKTTTS